MKKILHSTTTQSRDLKLPELQLKRRTLKKGVSAGTMMYPPSSTCSCTCHTNG
jgi:hypothetical protein